MIASFIILILFTSVIAEKSGPYFHSGWKPEGARLQLPSEYGAPLKSQINGQRINEEATSNSLQIKADLLDITTNLPDTTTDYQYETTITDRGYLPPQIGENPEDDSINFQQDLPNLHGNFNFNDAPNQKELFSLPASAKFSEWDDFKSRFFASQHQLQFGPKIEHLRVAPGSPLKSFDSNKNEEQLTEKPKEDQFSSEQYDGYRNEKNNQNSDVEVVNELKVSI